jgi:intracellular sulfur oxidation DsrE/DsrF family protein
VASLLCVCDQGYRASVEEQDDTVVWMAHMLQKSDNTEVALLLRGSAVNYTHKGQKSVGVAFGDWEQTQPADFPRDLTRFLEDGGAIFVLEEDMASHGLERGDLIDGVTGIAKGSVAQLVSQYDLVSFW